jgi:hypothetical protein
MQQPADDFGDDLVAAGVGGADADAGLGGTDSTGAPDATGQEATGDLGLEMGGQDDVGLGLDSGVDGGGFAQPEPAAMDTFTPEPEPQSDFAQEIAQADAVEDSFDSMFDDLGGTGQG